MSKQRNEINQRSGNDYSHDELNLAYQQCKSDGKEITSGNIEHAANEIRHDWNNHSDEIPSDNSRRSDNFRDYDDV